MQDIEEFIQKSCGRGTGYYVDRASGRSWSLQRDISSALPVILFDAIQGTQLDADLSDEQVDYLTSVASTVRLLFTSACVNNKEAMLQMRNLLADPRLQQPEFRSVLNSFFSNFFVGTFAYTFCSAEIAKGIALVFDTRYTEAVAAHSVLSRLSPELRTKVVAELRDSACIAPEIDLVTLSRRVDNFLLLAEEDARKVREIYSARRAASASENTPSEEQKEG